MKVLSKISLFEHTCSGNKIFAIFTF
uniref:Uncharacterized protein n=1 Tax=Heterorhabditis bacteriophora TaxID=37862 RepID=A0A1I7WKY7_HETBA